MFWTSFLAVALIFQCSIVSGWKVSLWENPNFKGAKYEFEGSGCLDYVGEAIDDKASSIFTNGICVRLYADKNCEGDFVDVHPESCRQFANLNNIGYNDKTSSMGPCVNRLSKSWKATLWEQENFKGAKVEFEGSGCENYVGYAINDKISSIDIHGMCVRLYADGFCRGRFIDVNPGMSQNQLSNLENLGFNDITSSIGPCTTECNPSTECTPISNQHVTTTTTTTTTISPSDNNIESVSKDIVNDLEDKLFILSYTDDTTTIISPSDNDIESDSKDIVNDLEDVQDELELTKLQYFLYLYNGNQTR